MPAVLWCLWEWDVMTWSFCFLLVLWRLEAVSLVNISVDVPGRNMFFFLKDDMPWLVKSCLKTRHCCGFATMLFGKLSNGKNGLQDLNLFSEPFVRLPTSSFMIHSSFLCVYPGDLSKKSRLDLIHWSMKNLLTLTVWVPVAAVSPSLFRFPGNPKVEGRSVPLTWQPGNEDISTKVHRFVEVRDSQKRSLKHDRVSGTVWWVNGWRWRFRDTNLRC